MIFGFGCIYNVLLTLFLLRVRVCFPFLCLSEPVVMKGLTLIQCIFQSQVTKTKCSFLLACLPCSVLDREFRALGRRETIPKGHV